MASGPASTAPKHAVGLVTLWALWVLTCIVLVAPVAGVLQLLASLMHRPAMTESLGLQLAVEALLYLAAAFVVFRVARRPGHASRVWVLAPAGYLIALGLYVLVMRLGASYDAAPRGSGWAIVIVDVLVTTLGGWAAGALGQTVRASVGDETQPPPAEATP